MKFLYTFFWILFILSSLQAQNQPKLVIGIVVDQMRMDYLYQYESLYGENGFKKLQTEGSAFYDCKFDYFPTYTAPGHTAVYTGAPPSISGIVANTWYDRQEKKSVYCASD
jgi:predicted AlkP superfamily pyrophosphatase or phosphodiesterase